MISRIEKKAMTHEHVLDAARTVIARAGFAGTTAREVAEEAGVAVGTVFVHFPTMGALAETILDEMVGGALDRAMRDLPDGLIDRLLHVAQALFEAYDLNPELSRQVLAGSLFESDPDGPSARRIAEFRAWGCQQVASAVTAGEIPPIDPDHAFSAYFAIYFGALAASLRGEMAPHERRATLRGTLIRLFAIQKEN
jgi:AcrR family transcriptional regulator